jgi:hypothetical protein
VARHGPLVASHDVLVDDVHGAIDDRENFINGVTGHSKYNLEPIF